MDYPVLITKKINFPLTYKSGALGKLKVGILLQYPLVNQKKSVLFGIKNK